MYPGHENSQEPAFPAKLLVWTRGLLLSVADNLGEKVGIYI